MLETTPKAKPRRLSRGQVVVIFAGAMTLFVGVSAIVIDVSYYWSTTLRMQRVHGDLVAPGRERLGLPADPRVRFVLAADHHADAQPTMGYHVQRIATGSPALVALRQRFWPRCPHHSQPGDRPTHSATRTQGFGPCAS